MNLEFIWRDGTRTGPIYFEKNATKEIWRLVYDNLKMGALKRGGLSGLVLKPAFSGTGGIWKTTYRGKQLTIPFGIGGLQRKETS